MLEALRRKRMGEGAQITIIVGSPDETQQDGVDHQDMGDTADLTEDADSDMERKELGLAPDATELGDDEPLQKPVAPGDTKAQDLMDQNGPGMMADALDKSPLLGNSSMHARMKRRGV